MKYFFCSRIIVAVVVFFLVSLFGSFLNTARAQRLVSEAQRVRTSESDAEEDVSTGNVNLTSSDLELVEDGERNQIVGLRFGGVDVPQNVSIHAAYIQFSVDEPSAGPSLLNIHVEATDHASVYRPTQMNISSRPLSMISEPWIVFPWGKKGDHGNVQRTPDLSLLVQEVVDRPGWESGHAMAFVFKGFGHRVAKSWDGDKGKAPVLHLVYEEKEAANEPPNVELGEARIVRVSETLPLVGQVEDDGLPLEPGLTTIQWTQVSGPSEVIFSEDDSVETVVEFPSPGAYTLRLTASDGEKSGSDDVLVLVTLPSDAEFVAYNDLSWHEGQIAENITRYTTAEGSGDPPDGSEGLLVDYLSGAFSSVTLSVSGGTWHGSKHALQGASASPGTDAGVVFDSIVDTTGVISYGENNIELEVKGLSPETKYTVIVFGDRGKKEYSDRASLITLIGATDFENQSSLGADFDGIDDPSAVVVNGENSEDGHVARFTRIDPGPDGSFSIVLSGLSSEETATPYASAFALLAMPPEPRFPKIELLEVMGGFDRPVFLTPAPDGTDRLFVVEQTGTIKLIGGDSVTTFLDIQARVRSPEDLFGGNEQGLLSIAFPASFASEQIFYVDYTREPDGATVVSSFRVDPLDKDKADPESEAVLLEIPQFAPNHNGGQLAFGPIDQYLYISTGDGGGGGDPRENGQELSSLLGKILRIDVTMHNQSGSYEIPEDNPFLDISGVKEEIWVYGLRNPWRVAFDEQTGDLFIGDVGQHAKEEIDFLPARDPGGTNFGWDCKEGFSLFETVDCDLSALTDPITDYGRGDGCSVTGGRVYRGGPIWSDLYGTYIFGDFCTGKIWGLKWDGVSWKKKKLLDSFLSISAFGRDRFRNLYLVDLDGTLYRILEQ